MTVAALLLAAGMASRYRSADPTVATKLVALLDGVPLVRRSAESALASRARPILVVTGYAEREVRHALDGLPLSFAFNADHASGLASSLRTGLAALPPTVRGALVLLGDMPDVTGDLLDRLITEFDGGPEVEAVVPVHGGRRGNPVLIGRSLFAAAMALGGDEGARRLLRRAREVVVEDTGTLLDIDDPAALRLASRDRSAREIV